MTSPDALRVVPKDCLNFKFIFSSYNLRIENFRVGVNMTNCWEINLFLGMAKLWFFLFSKALYGLNQR